MRVLLAVALAAATAVVPAVTSSAPAHAAIDTSTRASMYRSYQDVLKPALAVPIDWTGNVATCNAGAPSAAAHVATLTAVNWYREVAGVAPVTFSPTYDAQAQKAALMMEAQWDLSHSPDPSWACYSADGDAGAGSSNLALGYTSGARAIAGYMDDDGSTNTAVGHRRWILDPRQKVMGSGTTAWANALYVFGDRSQTTPDPAWVPWPPAGYLPVQAEPSGRWSLSAPDANFNSATVVVKQGTTTLPLTKYTPAYGYGSDTLVWQFDPGYGTNLPDRRYDVTVAGIVVGGETVSHSYSVTLFDGDIDADQTIGMGTLADRVYDTAPIALAATATSKLPVTFSSGSPSVCTVSAKTLTLVAAGTCIVYADQAGDAIRNPAPRVTRTFSVAKRSLTVTANDAARAVGVADPAFTASYSGFASGQTLATSGVTGEPSCTSTAVAESPKGTYPITCTEGTLASSRYAFSYVAGTLTVSGSYVPVQPARILDTRPGRPTVDGAAAGGGPVGAGATREVVVAGRGGVPATGAGAVALSLTVVSPSLGTHVTAWPTGSARPTASSLNAAAGVTAANLVIVPVGAGGRVSLYNANGSAHLLADVVGWFPSGGDLRPLVPARVMDTRAGRPTVDGLFAGAGALDHSSSRLLSVSGRGGVPASGAGAVLLNVTAVAPTFNTHLTVFGSDASHPQTSNLNVPRGATVANLVLARVGDVTEAVPGEIVLTNAAGYTHVVADVVGWFPDDAVPAVTPARLLDTRPGRTTIDGAGAGEGAVGPGGVRELVVTGRGGVPVTGAGAVLLNVTAAAPTASTYVTAWPTGAARPTASNLNPRAGVTTSNLVVVRVGTGGRVSLYNAYGSTNFVADVVGWFPD